MKKIIMGSLAVLMLFSLAACDKEPTKPATLGGTAAGWSRSGTSALGGGGLNQSGQAAIGAVETSATRR